MEIKQLWNWEMDGRLEDGRLEDWKMEDGRWKTEDGRWKKKDGRFEDGRFEEGRRKIVIYSVLEPCTMILLLKFANNY